MTEKPPEAKVSSSGSRSLYSIPEVQPTNPSISAESIEAYWKRGYWIAPKLIDDDRLATAREAVGRAYAGDLDGEGSYAFGPPTNTDDPNATKSLLFGWRVNDVIRDLVSDPTITAIAAALMKTGRVRLWQDQLIWKPCVLPSGTSDTGNIGFHQDYAYWQDSSTTNMISANIALQNTNTRSGALRVFPGSHLQGLISGSDVGSGAREEVLDLVAGQVTFHHSLTVHGSGPNTSDAPRLVVAPAYMPDGTYYRPLGQSPSPHSRLLGSDRSNGSPYSGEYFPLVYPTEARQERH